MGGLTNPTSMHFSIADSPDARPAAPRAALDLSPLPPWWARLETLWLLVAPLCAALYTLCLTLAPNDLWYHVRAGELISRGAIPTQNAMSGGIALGTPYYYQSWLAELGLFWTLRIGGLSGLVMLRALCVTAALTLVTLATFRALMRREQPSRLQAARLTAFGAVIGLAMFSNNVDLRPQTFSTPLFGAWIFGVMEWRAQGTNRRGWGAFLVILTLGWANTHGAFITSVLGLGALAASDFFWRRERFVASLGVALAAGAAVLVNPRGAALYSYVANLSRDQISQKWIQEWKSPGFDEWHSLLFWMSAAGIATLLLSKKLRQTGARGDAGLLLLLGLFGLMAARDQRSIIWFALAFVPVFALLLADLGREKPAAPLPVLRGARLMNAILLVFLLALPLALLPHLKPLWPWPPEFRRRFAATPALFASDPTLILDQTTPVAAAQWLSENPPRGRLWTDMVCGSYLTYAGRGQIVPLCDPRIELFPVAFWEDYLQLSGGPADAAAILQKRGFTDALIDRQSMPALAHRLQNAPNWRVVAQNGSTVLFHRQISGPRKILPSSGEVSRISRVKSAKLAQKTRVAKSVFH